MKKILLSCLLAIAAFGTQAHAAYWQQYVHYEIDVRLDDDKHMLHGYEKLTYVNNSPDQLTYIYMHIWPNAYKDNNTALGQQLKENGELFFYYAKDEDRGYIDSLDWHVDGEMVPAEIDYNNPDIVKLILTKPLDPGAQCVITTPFRVKIPSGRISRLGHIGQQYQITQWYPKPAVYDSHGWNPIPYLDQGEFYSEFGMYDVKITLPKNYVLGATGDIVNNKTEVDWLNELAEKTKDKKEFDKKDLAFPASSTEMKTVHFHQENVHDFAWFCDKRYNVLKGEVELPHSKRKVTSWVMFTNQYADLWKDAIPYVNDAVYYYSLWNGDYQYNHCTAVDGALSAGGGMEYPNITVIGGVNSPGTLETVIMHEVGHNWFYGMLGSNERVHGWMDEGINSSNELRYNETKYPNGALAGGKNGPRQPVSNMFDLNRYKQKAQYYQLYAVTARQCYDQPIETHSADFTTMNYAAVMYMKSAVCFDYLRGYLGDSLYDKCFRTYFDRWHFKHPQPEDLRAVFEEVSGRSLSWFFDDMIGTDKKLDYKITDAKKDESGWKIGLKNVGEISAPVSVSAVKNGQVVKTVWFEGFTGESNPRFPMVDADYFIVDQPEDGPDVNRKNNTIKSHGVLKKTEPLRLQFLGSLDNPSRTQLFFTPALGYNKYDGFMLGAAFYNHLLPQKRFEWCVMPMYGFSSGELVGHADAFLNFSGRRTFQLIRVGVNANQYSYYTPQAADYPYSTVPDRTLMFRKIAPEVSFLFKKKRARSPLTNQITLRAISTTVDQFLMSVDSNDIVKEIQPVSKMFYEAKYTLRNSRNVNPWNMELRYQMGDNMSKLSLTANYTVNYANGKGFHFRLFGGTFLDNSNSGPYRWRMSGYSPRGLQNQDYLFDHIFIGRTEQSGGLAQQFAEEDGAFKMYSPVGQSNNWLLALNVKIDLPVKNRFLSRFKLYADFGPASTDALADNKLLYNSGVMFTLASGVCDVYFPILWAQDIDDYYKANGLKYNSMIRFTFNIGRFGLQNFSSFVNQAF
jgi:hypothetical protein